MNTSNFRILARGRGRSVLLTCLFVLCFVAPIFLAGKVADRLFGDRHHFITDKPPFPILFESRKKGNVIKIANSKELTPSKNSDFLLFGWFRLKSLPKINDKIVLFSKLESAGKFQKGYSLGLVRENQGLRPAVYWRSEDGQGGWHFFSEISIVPKEWFLISLSFTKGQFLAIHISPLYFKRDPRVSLLGGYQIDNEQLPDNNTDLSIGSSNSGLSKAEAGPVGILLGRDFDPKRIISAIVREPNQVAESISPEDIKLWISGEIDLSESKHEILLIPSAKHQQATKTEAAKPTLANKKPMLLATSPPKTPTVKKSSTTKAIRPQKATKSSTVTVSKNKSTKSKGTSKSIKKRK